MWPPWWMGVQMSADGHLRAVAIVSEPHAGEVLAAPLKWLRRRPDVLTSCLDEYCPWKMQLRDRRQSSPIAQHAGSATDSKPTGNLIVLMNPQRPVGLMDKASASGAGDSRFESWAGHTFCLPAPPEFTRSFPSDVLRWSTVLEFLEPRASIAQW